MNKKISAVNHARLNATTYAEVLKLKPLGEMNNNAVENGASSYETSTPMKDNPESASRNSKAQTLDALKEHINIHELSLVKSLLTPSNGNCWYSAICDQSVSRTSLTNQTLLTE